jgi:CRISPR/Cas system-associated protein Csx1
MKFKGLNMKIKHQIKTPIFIVVDGTHGENYDTVMFVTSSEKEADFYCREQHIKSANEPSLSKPHALYVTVEIGNKIK